MKLIPQIEKAMELIAEMPSGDPDDKVKKKLEELESTIKDSFDLEIFGDIWEAYLANK